MMRELIRRAARPLWAPVRWRVEHIAQAEAQRVEESLRDSHRALDARMNGIEERLQVLEREAPVMAAQVAAMTMQVAGAPNIGTDAEALARVRLAAVSFYEERLRVLEERLG